MTKQNFLTLLILGLVLNFYCINVYGWHQLPGNGLEVDAIAANADESRIILGLRNAGFWQTDDSGENWIPINDRILPPNASTFYPKVIDELYMLDAEGDTIITRYQCDRSVGWAYSISTDGGNNWNAVMPPNTIYNTQNEYMEIDPADHNRFYYCNATHFTYSLDFGTTWEDTIRIDSLGNFPTDFVIDYFHPDTLFRAEYNQQGINYSYDRGQTWINTRVAHLYGLTRVFIRKVVVMSNGELIAFPHFGYDSDNNYHIVSDPILSSDGGQTWELIETAIPSDFYTYEAIEVPENNGNIIISSKGSAYSYGVQISTDYGRSFEEVYSNFPEPSISIFGINVNRYSNIIYVCTSGYGVFRSTDGGFTWNYFETIEPLGRFCNYNINQNSISSLAYWDHVAEYYDFESENWYYLSVGSSVDSDSITSRFPFTEFEDGDWFSHQVKVNIADSGRRFSIIRSSNSGESWEEVGNSTYEDIQSDSDGYFKCYFGENSSRIIWYEQATTALLVHTSLDTAQTWSSPSQFAYGSIVRSTVQTEDTVYALVDNSDDEGIYYSTDNCQTWQNTNFPSISSTRGILEMELDQETGILYTFSNRHCYSFDGSNWTQLGNVNSVFNIAVMPNGDSPIIVASGFNQYLHISTDGGNNWSRCDSLLPFSRQIGYIYKVKYDPWRDRIWISTSIGMMYAEREDLLSVDDPGSSFIPLGSNPIQAYPNPFNSSINITYTIELPGSVELKLFNLSGQEIASLYSGNINRGRYKLTYDASHLASGTYFLKLDEGGAIHTQKVTLIK